jgi:2,4-dienoyl-CoA reductase-like NADH-dependent reductase (Old Yellow Enzyme family)/thioredoxin reductase/acetoacetate decarboxylase
MYEKLFSEGKIGKLTLKNRLVMSPMGIGLAELDGTPSEDMIAFYEARAMGGAGLIIPEITRVNDDHGAGLMRQLSVTKDMHIKPLSKLADAIHRHGSKIFIQLHHPGREGVSMLIGGQAVVSASAIPCKVSKQDTRELSTDEVKQLIGQFVDGAERVKKAGCDGVELHCAHGYLLQQFLSPYTNKRTDEYGGGFENRMRMVTEIISGIRERCGKDFPLGIRLSVEEFLDKTGVTEDYIHIQDGVKIAMYFEAQGIDYIDVSCGLYETGMTCVEPISFPQGWRHDMIKAVKDHVKIPVIGVSVIREPDIAEYFLDDGTLDFVSMGRSWLADEQWGEKVRQGREDELCKCINCLRCFESLEQWSAAGIPPECAVNPRMAREKKFGIPEHVSEDKYVVVIGGGPGGMEAAKVLAQRGVRVTLIDDKAELGGTVNYAKLPPLKERMQWVADYYKVMFSKLGVEVKLGVRADAEMVAAMKPDAVIVATGSSSVVPESIPGVKGENVFTVEDVLSGKTAFSGKKVAVIGAGLTGLETAEFIAEKGNSVIIADMLKRPAPTANATNVGDVCTRLNKMGTQFIFLHALKEIRGGEIVLEDVNDKTEKIVPVDAVVLSLGNRPNNDIANELTGKGFEVKVIGSAKKDGMIAPATGGGYAVASRLFAEREKQPQFLLGMKDLTSFCKKSVMAGQQGVYMAYLTDPVSVAKVLPKPFKPYMMPIVTVSVCRIANPTFADAYYETILGVYATYNGMPGLYPVSILLGGVGAEMATQCGRDIGSMPKKLGADIFIHRNGDSIHAGVCRRGSQIVDAKLKIGETNNAMTDMVFQFPQAGSKGYGSGYYCHFDMMPDADGSLQFLNGAALQNEIEYDYKAWDSAYVDLKVNSSADDPWGSLPIVSVIGGAWCENDLTVHKLQLLEQVEAQNLLPFTLTARYDRTMFMEPGTL